MKKNIIYVVLAFSLLFLLSGCNSSTEEASVKQSASAKQTVTEDLVSVMTVDLTGGYSVEFASGAAYFYKGDSLDKSKVIANAYVIDKDSYDEETSYFKDNKDLDGEFKELKDGGYSYTTESNIEYYFPSNDDLYLKVVVQDGFLEDADSIYTRFSAHAND